MVIHRRFFPVIDSVLSSFVVGMAARRRRLIKPMAIGFSGKCMLIVVPDVFISLAHHLREIESRHG